MGPMTGRAAGYCASNTVPGCMTPGPGRGFNAGFGGRGRGGRGFRNRFFASGAPGWARAGYTPPVWGGYPPQGPAPTAEQQLDVLRVQAENLGGALENIKERIKEIEAADVSA
jgi:hypothetical protein